MKRMRWFLTLASAALGLVGCAVGYGTGAAYDERPYQGFLEHRAELDAGLDTAGVRVLMFTKTLGWRHDAIPTSKEVMRALAERFSLELTLTEDASLFTPEALAAFDVVMFASTTGEVLEGAQREALQGFIEAGGGYVGVHAASDTLYTWPWYGNLVGAYFSGHPFGTQVATVRSDNPEHPLTQHLGAAFELRDEWYFFDRNPRNNVQVLLTLDTGSNPVLATYPRADPDGDHPITWCHPYEGGRSWYTALGHRRAVWRDVRFQELLLRGVVWAAGRGSAC